jgi:hypothetical protein
LERYTIGTWNSRVASTVLVVFSVLGESCLRAGGVACAESMSAPTGRVNASWIAMRRREARTARAR